MNLLKILEFLYPEKRVDVDYTIIDRGQGPEIQQWIGEDVEPIATYLSTIENSIEFQEYLSKPTVPEFVTPRQGIEMLIEADMYDAVVAYIDSIPGKEGEKAKNRFNRANEFRRDDPLVIAIATAQGMTTEQIDQMFIDAAQYE